MDAGYTKEIFGSLYQTLFDHQEGLAHIEIPYPDVYQVLETIGESGGVAVMAHPGECKKEGLLEELAASGLLDGRGCTQKIHRKSGRNFKPLPVSMA